MTPEEEELLREEYAREGAAEWERWQGRIVSSPQHATPGEVASE